MKIFKNGLHWKILIGMFLGTVFGVFFSINHYSLDFEYEQSGVSIQETITNWEYIEFSATEIAKENTITFNSDEQLKIIKFVQKNRNNLPAYTVLVKTDKFYKEIKNIISITKTETIATQIKPFGTLFIKLLSFISIPLVLASLIIGAASLGDVKKLGRIGIRTFAIYIMTTAVAVGIGLLTANIIRPGNMLDKESKSRLLGDFQADAADKFSAGADLDLVNFALDIVPKNPFTALAEGNMIQIVFFAVMLGITLTFVEKSKSDSVVSFFTGISEAMIKMVHIIMMLAPIGVFALISATVADFGVSIIQTLIWYIMAVLLGLFLQTILVYPLIVKYLGKMNVRGFFKGIRTAQIVAFSTSSSAATLPVTFECVEENLKVPKSIAGFVLPLGATINMDGTALYQGVAAVFIAQVYGIDLNLTQQLTIVLTAVLASIGTAPVPGVGIIMLVMILQSVHIPAEGIALIIGVDRLLDMARTVPNVTGDSACAAAIANMEKDK